MSTSAIHLLQQSLEDQKGKLDALAKEHEPAIRAGRDAQRIVDAQKRHVQEIAEAIDTLRKEQASKNEVMSA